MIWKLPFSKEYRKGLYFVWLISLVLGITVGYVRGYFSMVYMLPLLFLASYLGFMLGVYLNKRADKKV